MPITEKQREQRKNYLGGSDAPAVVGVDPWKTAADVYLSKVQNLSEPNLGEAAQIGNLCEDAVLKWFRKETGFKITRNQFRVHENGFMAAHLDAVIHHEHAIVEAKTAGIITPFDRDQWGEIGTDQIPEKYIVQCQHQMAVMGAEIKIVWVPVLLGGVGFRMYRVERNDDLIQSLQHLEEQFWKEHVQKNIPPPDSLPSLEIIKRLQRIPKKIVPIEDSLIQGWLDAKATASAASKLKDESERKILAALEDAEAAECGFGTLTYFEQHRSAYTVKEQTFRVPRFKKNGDSHGENTRNDRSLTASAQHSDC
ncbi:MAG TPA: hypothetical protein DDW49_00255 [Deltaproteobacteria bacterium]|nr:MAG: hypothetical protein A2048_01230 [Deltaproteobacteria bacterium GWA2_45_12]HBF11817.1 hypothetical protein [Deltaproteobacteria bacterium]